MRRCFITIALKHIIRKVQENQKGMELNGTQQLLVYADDVSTLCKNINAIRETQKLCYRVV
jgi:hypothetical protein